MRRLSTERYDTGYKKGRSFQNGLLSHMSFSTDYTVANAKGGWEGVFRVSATKRKQDYSALTHLLNQMPMYGF